MEYYKKIKSLDHPKKKIGFFQTYLIVNNIINVVARIIVSINNIITPE